MRIRIGFLWLSINCVSAFTSQRLRRLGGNVALRSTEAELEDHRIVVRDRFHDDMRRVLQSRRDQFLSNCSGDNILQRSRRPRILERDEDGADRVFTMLERLTDLEAANEESFQICMKAYVDRGRLRWKSSDEKRTTLCAADQLEKLYQNLIDYREPPSVLEPETYLMVLEAYANCATPRGERYYAQAADELLQRLEATLGSESLPDEAYMHVIHAYSWQQGNMKDSEEAPRARALLDRVVERCDNPEVLLKCYDWVLEAFSKSANSKNTEQVDDLMSTMQRLVKEEGTKMSVEAYQNTILTWAKANHKGSAERAFELLKEMVHEYEAGKLDGEPRLISFNGVISAWSRVGQPKQALETLELLEGHSKQGNSIQADLITYNTVLYAHLRSNQRKEALQDAIKLVERMEQEDVTIRPNTFTYSTLIKCWIQSRHPEAAVAAEKLLAKMQNLWDRGDTTVEPSNRVFNMVINAYSKSRHDLAHVKAEALLERMKHTNNCQPDIFTTTSVMECWSQSGDPKAAERVEELLDDAFATYQSTGDKNQMPNLRTFTMAILTLSRTNGSVQSARKLLTNLVTMYEETKDPQLLPNSFPYNYVLNCAANSLGDKEVAFQCATKTYQELRQSDIVSPDSYTYTFWLKCCNNLLPRGELHSKCVQYSVAECKSAGLVSQEVLTRLFQGSGASVIDAILELDPTNKLPYRSMTTKDLPEAWSRNVGR